MTHHPCHCGGSVSTEFLGIKSEGKAGPDAEYPSGPEWAHKIVTRSDGTRLRAYLVRCNKCSSLRNDFEEVQP